MSFNLIVSSPGKNPVLYELNADRIGIGRSPDNQIQVDADCISYSHAELSKDEDGSYELRDLDSKNGTRLNGLSIRSSQLEDGDRILLAETVPCYFVELDGAGEPKPAVKPAPASEQAAAATYVTLQDKLQEFERKLEKVRKDFDSKQAEFDDLNESIDVLTKSIENETKSGADQKTIDRLKKDLINKTQRVSVLKDDLEGAKDQIETLEATRKVAIKAPEPEGPPNPALPKKPSGGSALPKKPGGAIKPGDGPSSLPKKPFPVKPGSSD